MGAAAVMTCLTVYQSCLPIASVSASDTPIFTGMMYLILSVAWFGQNAGNVFLRYIIMLPSEGFAGVL